MRVCVCECVLLASLFLRVLVCGFGCLGLDVFLGVSVYSLCMCVYVCAYIYVSIC